MTEEEVVFESQKKAEQISNLIVALATEPADKSLGIAARLIELGDDTNLQKRLSALCNQYALAINDITKKSVLEEMVDYIKIQFAQQYVTSFKNGMVFQMKLQQVMLQQVSDAVKSEDIKES